MGNHLFDHFAFEEDLETRVFLITTEGIRYTYSDALQRSGQFAQAFAQAGVGLGDRVIVQLDKCPDYLMIYLACLRCGAVFVPLNTAYTESELSYFIDNAAPRLVICNPQAEAGIVPLADRCRATTLAIDGAGGGRLSELVKNFDGSFQNAERGGDDPAAILYTSGTTGRSKGAVLSHENLASNARTLVSAWRFSKEDMLLHALPIFHTHGLFVATNTTLVAGSGLNFHTHFDADEVIAWLDRSTVMMGVPTFYVRLLQHPALTADLVRNMRLFISGSAPLLAETHVRWQERTRHSILERYGMTETNMLTSNPYDGVRVPGAVGPPLPGVEVRVTDPDRGNVLACGEIGMIEVQGPNVFSGYWQMSDANADSFRDDGFFITGDLGKIDENGYIHIVGRSKDLVISGGFNVYPKEVEAEIDAIAGVVESAVFGVAHSDFGEGVTAVVVKDEEARLSEDGIREHLKAVLANFKIPKRIIFVEALPRNTMGKVQKNVLRDDYQDIYKS